MKTQGWWVMVMALACSSCDDRDTQRPTDAAVAPDRGPRAVTPDDWPAAVEEAEPGATLILSEGVFPGNIRVPPGVTLQGAGSRDTCLMGAPDDVVVELAADSTLRDLCVEGGAIGVRAEAVARVDLERVEVRDSTTVGVHLERVDMAELVDVSIRGVSGPEPGNDPPPDGAGHLIVRASAVGVLRGVIGPGAAPGVSVDWPGDGPPADCDGGWAGCPYSGLLGMREVQVEQTAGAAVTARHAAVRITGGRIVAGNNREATFGRGINGTMSALMIDGGTTIDCGGSALPYRQGVACASCRTYVDDLAVQGCSKGGVLLRRLPSAQVSSIGFPAAGPTRFPVDTWPPDNVWQPRAQDAADRVRFPDMDWYPAEDFTGPVGADEALPRALQIGGDDEVPELRLHRWARGEWRDVEVRDSGVFGLHVSGHAIRLLRPHVSALSLPAGVDNTVPDERNIPIAVFVGEEGMVQPVSTTDGTTVGFSQIVEPRLEHNAGRGLFINRCFVSLRTPVASGAVDQVLLQDGARVRVTASDLGVAHISENQWGGLTILNSVATIDPLSLQGNGGYGALVRGAAVNLSGTTVEGTQLARYGSDGTEVEAGHGVVIDATRSDFVGFDSRLIEAEDILIRGAAQAGLLFRALEGVPIEGRVSVDRVSDAEVAVGYLGLDPDGEQFEYRGPEPQSVDYALPP